MSKILKLLGLFSTNIFTKTVSCGSITIEKDKDLINCIETMFINKIKEFNKYNSAQIINIDKKMLDYEDIDIISLTINKFLKDLDAQTNECFALIPEDIDKLNYLSSNLFDVGVYKTDKLKNEIIFGKKTSFNMPGIVLITNEEGLKDKTNIRFAVCDIGFFPGKAYYTIKINK